MSVQWWALQCGDSYTSNDLKCSGLLICVIAINANPNKRYFVEYYNCVRISISSIVLYIHISTHCWANFNSYCAIVRRSSTDGRQTERIHTQIHTHLLCIHTHTHSLTCMQEALGHARAHRPQYIGLKRVRAEDARACLRVGRERVLRFIYFNWKMKQIL